MIATTKELSRWTSSGGMGGSRFLCLGALLMLPSPAPAQENDPEKLFRSMERKVLSAKSLEIVCTCELAVGGMKVTLVGKVLLADGNVFRMDSNWEQDGKREEALMVCNGKTIYNKDAGRIKTHPAREDDTRKPQGYVSRVGFYLAGLLLAETIPVVPPKNEGPFDLDKVATMKEFKAGAKERVGQKEAQAVECSVRVGRHLGNARMVVWIDLQTQLPLKRTVEMKMDGKSLRSVETYTTFALGTKIDAKVFRQPK